MINNSLHDTINHRSINSCHWKSIMKLAHNLFSSGSWIMGDGRNIDVRKDSWVEPRLRIIDYGLPISKDLVGASLCELVDSNDDWNWQII